VKQRRAARPHCRRPALCARSQLWLFWHRHHSCRVRSYFANWLTANRSPYVQQVMGCGPSADKGPKPPKDAPADWKAKVEAAFTSIDKDKAGSITTVPHKKAEDYASEVCVLGPEVLAAQEKIGDLPKNDAMTLETWVETIRTKCEEKGWAEIEAFLGEIEKAVASDAKGGWEELTRSVFKKTDSNWCEPADTGKVDFHKELKEMGDKTDEKVAKLIEGLAKEPVGCDVWVTHVSSKLEPMGWPRVVKYLTVIKVRLDKICELDDMGVDN